MDFTGSTGSEDMKVLLVDDERDMLEQAKLFLEREEDRLKIDTATSAEDGLELFEEEDYDGIVSDYQMPGMNGLEFLKTVREDLERKIPFIIFTGRGREEVAIKALNIGANRYLQKGGDPKSQYAILAQAIVQEVDRRRERKISKRNRKRYRMLVENSSVGIAVIQKGGIRMMNDSFVELTGYTREEIAEMNPVFPHIIHPDDLDRMRDIFMSAMMRDGSDLEDEYEHRLVRKDGEVRWVKIVPNIVDYDGEPAVLQNTIDITERKRAKEQRRKSREKYRQLTEEVNDLVLILDFDGFYRFANNAHKEILGYEPEELEGEHISKFLHPDGVERVKENFEEAKERGEGEVMLRHKTKEGDYRWIESHGRILPDEEKTLIVGRDVTERKKREGREEFLHSLLRHDVRNKTQVVQSYLELLEGYNLPGEAEDIVEKAKGRVSEGVEIIEKVRTLRQAEQEEETRELDLGTVLEEAIEKNEQMLSSNGIDLEHEIDEVRVEGGSLLRELFSNLLENSSQHSGGSKVRIRTMREDGEVTVTIEDDGRGIPDENKENVFEKRVKWGEAAGSGLGLYLVREIAESYGGSVELKDSELGGVRFDIRLNEFSDQNEQ